jgi:hypothetical protein
MRTLTVTDTIRESFDESGRKIDSLEAVARGLSGLPVVREVYSYEMIRYTGRTKKYCLDLMESDLRCFLKPIGEMDIRWI